MPITFIINLGYYNEKNSFETPVFSVVWFICTSHLCPLITQSETELVAGCASQESQVKE